MGKGLSNCLSGFVERAGDVLKTGAKVVIGGLMLYSFASHNGMLDSNRTKEAERL